MMKKNLCLLFLMCFICSFTYSQQNTPSIYHSIEYGYSVEYPSDWEIEEYQENGTVSIYEHSQNSSIHEHIQISVALWEDGDLSEFVNTVNIKDLENLYSDFSIDNHFQDESKCIYELSYLLNEVRVNSIFYFLKENDNVYIFLAMAEDDDNYESDREIFMNIIDSTRFQ